MKILICGLGKHSYSVIEYLYLQEHNLTVIDEDQASLKKISEKFDVRIYCAPVASISKLTDIDLSDSDFIITVTDNDEINMMLCRLYKILFNVRQSIAFIQSTYYLRPEYYFIYDIDFIISSDLEAAQVISNKLFSMFTNIEKIRFFNSMGFLFIPLEEDIDCEYLDKNINQKEEMLLLGVYRKEKLIKFSRLNKLKKDDVLWIIYTFDSPIFKVIKMLRPYSLNINKVVIIGGYYDLLSNILKFTEQQITDITLIENDKASAISYADSLSNDINQKISVINGNPIDTDILKEAKVDSADVILSLSNDDYVNIFSMLLSKQLGCKYAITMLNNAEYFSLAYKYGLDLVINYNEVIKTKLFECLENRYSFLKFKSVRDNINFLMLEIITEDIINILNELPEEIEILCVFKNKKLYIYNNKFTLNLKDFLVLYCEDKQLLFGYFNNKITSLLNN